MEVNRANQAQAYQDEQKWASYNKERRSQNELEIAHTDAEHQRELDSKTAYHKKQMEEMSQAYKVELTRMREGYEKELANEQKNYEKTLKAETGSHEKEFERIRERERARIDAYKRNQDETIEKLHEKYQLAQDELKARNS